MKRGLAVLLSVCILGLTGCSSVQKTAPESSLDFFAMNTYISMTAYGKQAKQALEDAREWTEQLEALWSVTEESSDLYAINHSDGSPVTVNDDTAKVLAFAMEMAGQTGGMLEPTIYPVLTAWGFTTDEKRVPSEQELSELLPLVGYENVSLNGNEVTLPSGMMLDLGAVGKGYASDEAAKILRDAGVPSALLDFGGNILAVGSKPDGSDWRLGLKDPFADGNIGILEVSDCAVVTSGNYENYFAGEDGRVYGHIIDPRTGYPADNDLASVTIISQDGKLCDALSTALFVMGKDGAIDYWRQNPGFEMILIGSEREIYITEGIADTFIPAENTAMQVIQV